MANDVSYFKVSGDSTTYQFNDPDAETAINANASAIGTLSNLTTSAKGSLVAAINEVDAHADTNASAISSLNSNLNRLFRTYSNLTVTDTNPYALIDSYASMGIDSSKYLLSMNIRGWSGVSCGGISLVKGSNGTDIYVMGSKAGSIASLTVEYFFANTVGSF